MGDRKGLGQWQVRPRERLKPVFWSTTANAAFLVRPNGEIARGLDAFLALLPGLKGGRVLSVLLSLPLVKPVGYLLYWFVARYRYAVFGKVPLARASESPNAQSREVIHK